MEGRTSPKGNGGQTDASSGYAIQYHEPAIVGSHKLLTDIYDLLSMTWSDDRNLVDLHANCLAPGRSNGLTTIHTHRCLGDGLISAGRCDRAAC